MHDDITLTVNRTKRVLAERLWPAVYSSTMPLEVSWNELPGEPIPPERGLKLAYTPVSAGVQWGPAWGTTWFKLAGTVPLEWAGRRVEVHIDLGFDPNMTGFQCEGLVYTASGEPLKSVNPKNQWVLIADSAQGGERVELYVEAAANPVLLDYHPFLPTREGDIQTSSKKKLYTSRAFDLVVFEAEVHALCLDIEVLFELQEELPEGTPRKMTILQGLDDALDRVDLQRIPETASQARAELAPLLTKAADASSHQISAIGHAHIDSAWLWPLRETIRKVARTSASMVELLGEDADFLYGMSSAQQYKWLKQHRPEVWEKVKAAVAAGRFIPLGGMWVESDTVMPSGEALARQFLYGQSFFRNELGVNTHGVWLPDSFGYSPALPQLMRRAGFDWFFTQKISWNQVNKFPHHTFNWEGIDGSRVFSHFPPMDTYTAELSGAELARATRQFRESRKARGSIAPTGWGDGGGGTTREMTGKAKRLTDLEGSATVRWEHPDAFFARAKTELPHPPVWVGELYLELHRATLTSQHKTKQGNRKIEHLLVEAELWSATAATRTDFEYPYAALDALWEDALLHQFHDILPGTSIAWVHREAVQTYARLIRETEGIIAAAIAALAGSGESELVFNASSVARDGRVALGASVVDAEDSVPHNSTVDADGTGFILRNDVVQVRIDAAGHVVSAIDLDTGRDAIAAGEKANVLQLHQDFPAKWDAWDVDRYYKNRVENLDAVTSIGVARHRGADAVVVERHFSESKVRQTLSLAPHSRTLQIDQETDWHETEKFLKVSFPLGIRAEHTAAETQFGFAKRVTHTNTSWEAAKFETSMHRFVLVEEPDFGAALVTESTYGFDTSRDVDDEAQVTTTVRLSLLRAPRFPDPETDQGPHQHSYGLVIGADAQSATEEGIKLNTPLRHVRGAGGVAPLAGIDGDGVLISSVKYAHDRSGDLIVRLYEPSGRNAQARLSVDAHFGNPREVSLIEDELDVESQLHVVDGGVELSLSPFSVRTFRFSRSA